MSNTYKEVLTPIDAMGGFYDNYRGKSMGRAMYYIYHICGLQYADSITFGYDDGKIRYYGREFAKADWSKGYPEFEFFGTFKGFEQRQKELLDQKPVMA